MSGPGKKRPSLVADKRYSKPRSKGAKPTSRTGNSSRNGANGGGGGGRRPPKRPRRTRSKGPLGRIGGVITGIAGFFLHLIWKLFLRAAIVVAILVAIGIGYYYVQLPKSTDLVDGRTRGSVTILDRYGETFAWRGDQFGGMITAKSVSPALKNAVIATEDRRFYSHFGVSPRGIASAIRINLSEGRGPLTGNGGSTITQQTAKLLCLGIPYDPKSGKSEADYEAKCRESSLWRKIKEAVFAMAMELKYTKDEILTIYLNRAFLGAGARGYEAAAQRYFGKSASEVRPAEAAMLAGLLVAPSRYAPTRDLALSQQRANVVIGLMEEQGYLTKAQADYARTNPATLSDAAQAQSGGYFADWVMDSGPSFLTRNTTEDVILRTTLDPKIQTAAEEALATIFKDRVSKDSSAEAAIVVMSADGAVRAMVGGRDPTVSGGFNRATMAKRQTGSAFKPFVYATALDMGYSYSDVVQDTPLTIDIPGSGPWSPKNYSRKYLGPVTLTDALRLSLNVPAVRVSEAVGRDNVRKVAAGFGIESDLAMGPALALGASEASVLEMTGAYAGFLNGGSSVTPYGLIELKLQGDNTPLMDQSGGMKERVISNDAARQLVYMMNQVVERGTGKNARLKGRPVAGKTGTTQSARDAWFVGFTADYVAGVWMGNDDNAPLTGVTGGTLPAAIWQEMMQKVEEGVPVKPLPMIEPASPPKVAASQPQPARKKRRTENILFNVLRQILGGGN